MNLVKTDFTEAEVRVLAGEHTKGELQLIRSPKHRGDIFVKVKDTRDTFICKFYGYGGDGKISATQAIINANYFLQCYNNYDQLLVEVENLRAELRENKKGNENE